MGFILHRISSKEIQLAYQMTVQKRNTNKQKDLSSKSPFQTRSKILNYPLVHFGVEKKQKINKRKNYKQTILTQ